MIDWKKITLENLAGFLSEELRKRGIQTILVGGACVTIYSQNRYQSYDLDFVTYDEMKVVQKALAELGFQVRDRYFVHEDCQWFVEFVSPPVSVGDEPITTFGEKDTPFGTIRMLKPEDSVKDRLASYFHWSDRQGLYQAVDICLARFIELKEVKDWSLHEGFPDKYQDFIDFLEKKRLENH